MCIHFLAPSVYGEHIFITA